VPMPMSDEAPGSACCAKSGQISNGSEFVQNI
jgi:hypothetical protein